MNALLLLLLLALLLSSCHGAAVDTRAHTRYTGPVYDVRFVDDANAPPPPNVVETIEETLQDSTYVCYVPKGAPSASALLQEPQEERSKASVNPAAMLAPLGAVGCLLRVESWWTYEFCFDKHVIQFHAEETGQRVAEFVLGKFDAQESTLHVDYEKKRVTQHYVMGQVCDLTGKPRKVEVQYRCNPKAGVLNYLEQLQEPATCEYLLVVVTPLVCGIGGMQDEPKHAPTILCKPKPSSPSPEVVAL